MKVLLVDDRTLFREGLQGFLQSNGVEVVGTARDGPEALEKVRLLNPDAILINITGAGPEQLEAIRRSKTENPAVKIIVFADNDENLLAAVQSGACGYLLTSIGGGELLQKLGALERGEVPFSPGLAARVLEGIARLAAEKEPGVPPAKPKRAAAAKQEQIAPAPGEGEAAQLTARQKEVLALVARGLTYREAGEALGLTERTVKYHMAKIMKRLNLKKREQAVAYVLQKGPFFDCP